MLRKVVNFLRSHQLRRAAHAAFLVCLLGGTAGAVSDAHADLLNRPVLFKLFIRGYGQGTTSQTRVKNNSQLQGAKTDYLAVKMSKIQIKRALPKALARLKSLGAKCKSKKKADIKKYQGRGGACDSDHDGLPNFLETRIGTSYLKKDTDGDGLTDKEELLKYGTDPLVVDTDGDGLSDGDEVHRTHTDPLNPDTNGNGIPDGVEFPPLPDPANQCSENNFDPSGNTAQFQIPAGLVGNVGRGQSIFKTQTCFKCHPADKGVNFTYTQLQAAVTGPLMAPSLNALGLMPNSQQLADLVAYLNQTQVSRAVPCPATPTATPTPVGPTPIPSATPVQATPTPMATPCPGGNFSSAGDTTAFAIPAPLVGNITRGAAVYTTQVCYRCHGNVDRGVGYDFNQLKAAVTGPLMAANINALGIMPNDQQFADLVAYLNRGNSGGNCGAPTPTPTPVDDVTAGLWVYQSSCQSCHYRGGDPGIGDLIGASANQIKQAIQEKPEMRSIVLTNEKLRVLVVYLANLR